MNVDSIRNALHREPFQAFSLRLADGREVSVPHPDFVAVSPRQVIVVNPADESVTWLEPLLIVLLEFAASASQPGATSGNGAGGPSGTA